MTSLQTCKVVCDVIIWIVEKFMIFQQAIMQCGTISMIIYMYLSDKPRYLKIEARCI